MNERHSRTLASRNYASDPVRPGQLLDYPAVQRRFYDAHQTISAPPHLAFLPPSAPQNKNSKERSTLLAKHARNRHRAVWAQALVLFNVVGIPLSHGPYLTQYFSTALPKSSLSALSVIPALQILCILSTPLPIGWWYFSRGQRSGWRLIFLIATLLAFGAQIGLQWVKTYIPIMIFQGPVLGVALGILFALSTLVLSSHYRFNLPLVSMQSGAMGFVGAIVHAIVARQIARCAAAANAGVLAGTLLVAYGLMQRVRDEDAVERFETKLRLPRGVSKIIQERGTVWFVLGYMLVFSSLFVFPFYIVAVLTQTPSLTAPRTSTWILVAMFATAALSACISANPTIRKRMGPTNTFIAACFFSGAASIVPAFMPSLTSGLVCGAAYGIGLGAVLALHIKVTTVFHSEKVVWYPDMPARAALMMALAGGSGFAGILVSAIVMESMQNGVKIVACVAAGCLGLGGGMVAVGRGRRCGRLWATI